MTKQKTDIREVLNEQVPEERDELYNDYVDENTPKLSWFANLCKAFLVGGLICTLGQVLINWYGNGQGDSGFVQYADTYFIECFAYRLEHLSENCQFCRSRNTGAYYRLC